MAQMTVPLPRFTSSWIWLLVLYTFAGFIEVVFWGQMTAFTPLYLPHLGVARHDVASWTGAIVAISSALGLPLLPLWGALADRYGRQPLIVRSFMAHFLAGVLALLAGSVWIFLLARAVQSLSLGNSGLMMTTLSDRAPANRLGFAFSMMNGAQPLGAFLGPLVGGPIVDAWGFHALLAIDLALLVVVILALTIGYRDPFVPVTDEPVLRMALGSVAIILRSGRLRTLFPALFLLFAGWMLAFTYIPLAVTALYRGHQPGTAVGLVLGAGGLMTLIMSPVMGGLADRFGHWRVLFAGSAVAIVLWPLPALAPNLTAFTILWALLNSAVSGTFAISFSVLSSSVSDGVRARIMSFSFLPVMLGFAIGPAIGSVVTAHSIFAIFPAAAVMTLLGLGMLVVSFRQEVSLPAGIADHSESVAG